MFSAVFAFSFFPVSVLGVFAFSRFRVFVFPPAAPPRPGHRFRVHRFLAFAFYRYTSQSLHWNQSNPPVCWRDRTVIPSLDGR